MESALDSFFVSLPQAVGLWLIILLGIAGAVVWMAVPRCSAPPTPAERDRARFADEVVVAAERAAAGAARKRADWAAAQHELEAAWAAFDEADRAARQAVRSGAYPLISRSRKPGENVDRQRYLHHAAIAACRQREISIGQLNEVLAHRGWNPRLHPVAQENALRQAIREHRMAGYESARDRERLAWQAAERAADALRSLRLEAAAATADAGARQAVAGEQRRADQWTTAELPAVA